MKLKVYLKMRQPQLKAIHSVLSAKHLRLKPSILPSWHPLKRTKMSTTVELNLLGQDLHLVRMIL